ncbi:MAG TPA: DUF642 domain-containing protein [Oscillatoriaceae cyanobacterium M33_DOE_052]|nr:DUF642 domain-containing protein [Oscillatoriaceae cyanobacterium M33_DOE_052]
MATRKTTYATLFATGLMTLISAKPALAGNLIKNGDFEQVDYIGSYTTYNSATVPAQFGWSISNDFVYLVNSYWQGVSGTTNPDGFDQSLELRPNATLSQTFATQLGQKYELSFWYAHDPDNQQGSAIGHMNVQGNNSLLADTLLHNIPSSRANLQFLQYFAQFTADKDKTTLSFRGDSRNGVHGFVIDGVSVAPVQERQTQKVPEPSLGLSLLIVGAFGISFQIRRRNTI